MIDKNFTYALVGASANPEKYWYKILQDLIQWWYKVLPINPNESEILWISVYSSLSKIPTPIDVVICVVPSSVTEKIVDEVISLWIRNIWMQPWSESGAAIQKCLQHWVNVVHDSCIMIQRKTNM